MEVHVIHINVSLRTPLYAPQRNKRYVSCAADVALERIGTDGEPNKDIEKHIGML